MVVDTGLHALGWPRERAVEFLLAHSALSHDQAAAEIDRYNREPGGQAQSYLLGYRRSSRCARRRAHTSASAST